MCLCVVLKEPMQKNRLSLTRTRIKKVHAHTATRKGYTVTSASDGMSALDLFKANPGIFDLIVTDQSMPRMSGTDLTREIRALKYDIPILLSTGHLGIEDKEEYSGIGITDFIQKPWTADELIARIQELD